MTCLQVRSISSQAACTHSRHRILTTVNISSLLWSRRRLLRVQAEWKMQWTDAHRRRGDEHDARKPDPSTVAIDHEEQNDQDDSENNAKDAIRGSHVWFHVYLSQYAFTHSVRHVMRQWMGSVHQEERSACVGGCDHASLREGHGTRTGQCSRAFHAPESAERRVCEMDDTPPAMCPPGRRVITRR